MAANRTETKEEKKEAASGAGVLAQGVLKQCEEEYTLAQQCKRQYLDVSLRRRQGSTEPDGIEIKEQAKALFLAAAKGGYIPAQYEIGKWMIGEGKQEEGIDWLETASAQGNLDALCQLGILYSGTQPDSPLNMQSVSLRYLRRAAESGSAFGSYMLACYIIEGVKGFPQSDAEIFKWAVHAVECGYSSYKIPLLKQLLSRWEFLSVAEIVRSGVAIFRGERIVHREDVKTGALNPQLFQESYELFIGEQKLHARFISAARENIDGAFDRYFYQHPERLLDILKILPPDVTSTVLKRLKSARFDELRKQSPFVSVPTGVLNLVNKYAEPLVSKQEGLFLCCEFFKKELSKSDIVGKAEVLSVIVKAEKEIAKADSDPDKGKYNEVVDNVIAEFVASINTVLSLSSSSLTLFKPPSPALSQIWDKVLTDLPDAIRDMFISTEVRHEYKL